MSINPLGDGKSQEVKNTAAAPVRSAGHSWTTCLWGRLNFLSTLICNLFGRRPFPNPTSSLATHRIASASSISTETLVRTDSLRDEVLSRASCSTESSLSLGSSPEEPRAISPTWSGSVSAVESSLERLKELESSRDYETILVEYAGISYLPDIQATWEKAYKALSSKVNTYHSWEGNKTAELLVTFAPRYFGQQDPRVLTKVSPFLRIAALTIRNKGGLSESQANTLTAIMKGVDSRASLKTMVALCQKAYKEVGADKCASIALCYEALTGKKLI